MSLKNLVFCLLSGLVALAALPLAEAQGASGKKKPEPHLIMQRGKGYTGDLDVLRKKRQIRALVPYSKTYYFLDGINQKGLSYEALMGFEKYLNAKLKTGNLRIPVVIIPVARDELLPSLVAGRGDIALGNLTVTKERLEMVDFSEPFMGDVREILVTGPHAAAVTTLSDLADREVHVRPSSSYHDSLLHLNETLVQQGRRPVKIVAADEYLEDEDLLEMVNAGIIPHVVVDEHKGRFWAQIFPHITLQQDIVLRSGGSIAWAVRKNCPKLKNMINGFARLNKKGTTTGNIIFKKYLQNIDYVRSAYDEDELARFRETIELFKKYGGSYSFDWLLLAAQGYQESRLDQTCRSHRGAVGVMQVLPTTAADPNVNIPDIHHLEPNIHAGTKYLAFMMERYYADSAMDQLNRGLFAFASYNAGPNRIRQLRQEAARLGLNPDLWFNNVELVAARRIGRETVQYVSNIYKYYIAYSMLFTQRQEKTGARVEAGLPARGDN